jgi:hypothetical protein
MNLANSYVKRARDFVSCLNFLHSGSSPFQYSPWRASLCTITVCQVTTLDKLRSDPVDVLPRLAAILLAIVAMESWNDSASSGRRESTSMRRSLNMRSWLPSSFRPVSRSRWASSHSCLCDTPILGRSCLRLAQAGLTNSDAEHMKKRKLEQIIREERVKLSYWLD